MPLEDKDRKASTTDRKISPEFTSEFLRIIDMVSDKRYLRRVACPPLNPPPNSNRLCRLESSISKDKKIRKFCFLLKKNNQAKEQQQRLQQSLEEQLFGKQAVWDRKFERKQAGREPKPRLVCFKRMHDDTIQMISSQDPVSIELIVGNQTTDATSITLFNPIKDRWKPVVLPVKNEEKLKMILEPGAKPMDFRDRASFVFSPFTKFFNRYRDSWTEGKDGQSSKSLALLDRYRKAIFVDGLPLELGLRCVRKLQRWIGQER